MNSIILDPLNDGVTHINVYSQGQTQLGMFLSNFTNHPIATKDGKFNSIEGYWYYLLSTDLKSREQLRTLSGFVAKKVGRTLAKQNYPANNDYKFQNLITLAIEEKILTSRFKSNFIGSTLPFEHYYVYNNVVNEPKEGRWVIEFLEKLRMQWKINDNGS